MAVKEHVKLWSRSSAAGLSVKYVQIRPSERDLTVVFFGRVHPERADVFAGPMELAFGPSLEDLQTAYFRILGSQIVFSVERLVGSATDMKNTVNSITRAVVDILALTEGKAFSIEITGCEGDGHHLIFDSQFPGFEPLATSVDDILSLTLRDPDRAMVPLRRALSEIRQAIQYPDDTAFHAFRSVECLTYAFGRNNSKGRTPLLIALNISNDWLVRNLEKPAGAVRHGALIPISEARRADLLKAAREAIDRFIQLKRRGVQQLPLAEFPLLE